VVAKRRDVMQEDLELAARYRSHANELRKLTETMSDNDARQSLLSIAIQYEHLASVRELMHQHACARQR